MSFKAAILRQHNAPLDVVELEHATVDHHGKFCSYGQVRVEMIASGICGAQLGEQAGHKNPDAPLPRLIGHEGVGIVREVGPGVSVQLLGRKVVCHWRKGDGPEAALPARYDAGKGVTLGGGHIVTLAESVVISANRVTPVPDNTPDELCALLGCGLSTALGTIEHEAKLCFGERVLILGCGGVGLSLILAARAAGAGLVCVMDKDESKEALATAAGADGFSPVLGALRFDVIVDTTGAVKVLEESIPLLSGTGRMIMLGQTKPGEGFKITNAVDRFYGQGAHLMWSQGGKFNPTSDIPRYIALWRSGRLNLNCVVSNCLPLSDVNEGFRLVREGQAGRVLIDCRP